MSGTKQFKDPIYGYIEIDSDIVSQIIDTPGFQRLRNIRQTSYAPLYPSAVHNRFVHSLGVFYLGQEALRAIAPQLRRLPPYQKDARKRRSLCDTFLMACLLHDVGHAPFSHTGEPFYLAKVSTSDTSTGAVPEIFDLLANTVGTPTFEESAKNRVKHAAAHEIMSAIVGIRQYGRFIPKKYREFFARCITGYTHENQEGATEKDIENCLIQLLNSQTIDVDRLDYIIRDAFATGFQSVSIDYKRLLGGLVFAKDNGRYVLAYHKTAFSIIENVIYAHDAERKWIQSHPVILYEHFLIQSCIRTVERSFANNASLQSLFSIDALSSKGVTLSDTLSVRLLSDDDILFCSKNLSRTALTDELFDRSQRRHPMWKSEAEYSALFAHVLHGKKLNKLEEHIEQLEEYLKKYCSAPIINQQFVDHCDAELRGLESIAATLQDNSDYLLKADDIAAKRRAIQVNREWGSCFLEFAEKNGLPFDFVIIKANSFQSGFLKPAFSEIRVQLQKDHPLCKIGEVSSILHATPGRDKFFYVYYRREEGALSKRNRSELTSSLASCLQHKILDMS